MPTEPEPEEEEEHEHSWEYLYSVYECVQCGHVFSDD